MGWQRIVTKQDAGLFVARARALYLFIYLFIYLSL
jgi:hypothetical protein